MIYCFIFIFMFAYIEDSNLGLNCWIWVIDLNISFLHHQFDSLFQIFILRKDGIEKIFWSLYFINSFLKNLRFNLKHTFTILMMIFVLFLFCLIYIEDINLGLNCWIWVIHLNISFLHHRFDSLFQIFIQKKKKGTYFNDNLIIIIS